LTLLILLAATSCAAGETSASRSEKQSDPKTIKVERQRLKNAAFCSCLRHTRKPGDTSLAEDGSLAAYMEIGAHDLEAFEAVDRAAAVYAKKDYPSKHGRTLAVMKCLDFYNSPQLEELVRSLDDRLIVKE
jgi:hypothetical protein